MGLMAALVMNVVLGLIYGAIYYHKGDESSRDSVGLVFAVATMLVIGASMQVRRRSRDYYY